MNPSETPWGILALAGLAGLAGQAGHMGKHARVASVAQEHLRARHSCQQEHLRKIGNDRRYALSKGKE